MALSYLKGHEALGVSSAKDIAAHYQLPPSLLAKVMQRLKRAGLVTSVKGTSGGYALADGLASVSFLEFIGLFDEDTALVECLADENHSACQQAHTCGIRSPIAVLNDAVRAQFEALTIEQLIGTTPAVPNLVSVQTLNR